ncbi:MAG TPA: hypothetical protein VFC78_03730 [Tepidisphaeraceae bacterium]|nr:hypothetical protein [Tepidisphaeraceae bacterium]
MSILQSSGLLEHLSEFTPQAMERWISAALAEAAALREHDDLLYPDDMERRSAAEQLHAAWGRWAREAQSLVDRVSKVRSWAEPIAGLDSLIEAIGRAQAIIRISPTMMARRLEQVRSGEVTSVEEIRRELQFSHRR